MYLTNIHQSPYNSLKIDCLHVFSKNKAMLWQDIFAVTRYFKFLPACLYVTRFFKYCPLCLYVTVEIDWKKRKRSHIGLSTNQKIDLLQIIVRRDVSSPKVVYQTIKT